MQSVIDFFKGKPLDILINNAAQTVRRPAPFYKHLLEAELQRPALENIVSSGIKVLADTKLNLPAQNKRLTSAEMSQLALLPEDLITNEKIFPAGKYDKDGYHSRQRVKQLFIRVFIFAELYFILALVYNYFDR